MLGLLTLPAAIVLCLLSAYGYAAGPISRPSPWPIRNGGEEAVVYMVATIYFALAGAGAWSIDRLMNRDGLMNRGKAVAPEAGTA